MKLHYVFGMWLAVWLGGADVRAQGRFTFNNATATAITNVMVVPYARASTNTRVAMYYSLNTNLSLGTYNYVLNPEAVTNLAVPGLFIGGTRTVPGVPGGTTIAVTIRAWIPPGVASDSDCYSMLQGESYPFLLTLATNDVPATPITGAGKLTPFVLTLYGEHGDIFCPPLVHLTRNSNMMELRMSPSGGIPPYYAVRTSSTLLSNSWVFRTNIPSTGNVTLWRDPIGTNGFLFYRVDPAF